MYKHLIILLFLEIAAFESFGQSSNLIFKNTYPVNNTDSLYNELKNNHLQGIDRLKTLIKLERSLFWTFSTRSVLPEIYELSKSQNNATGLVFYYVLNALMNASINKLEESTTLLNKANYLLKDIKDEALLIFAENTIILTNLTIEVKKGNRANIQYVYTINDKYNHIDLKKLDNYQLLEYYNVKYYLELVLFKSDSNSNAQKFLKLFNDIISKNDLFNFTRFAYTHFYSIYYSSIGENDKVIMINKALLSALPNMELFNRSKAYYYLGNAYVNSGQFSLATESYNKSLQAFVLFQRDKNNDPLMTEYRLNIFQEFIGNFLQTRRNITFLQGSQTPLESKKFDNSYFNPLEMDLMSIQNTLQNAIQEKMNSDLLIQKRQLEIKNLSDLLALKNKEIQMNKINYEKQKAIQNSISLKEKNGLLAEKNTLLNTYLFFLLFFLLLFLILVVRLYYSNAKIKKYQGERNHFYTLVSHDMRSVVSNFMGVGSVLRYLIQRKRLEDINEITERLDTDAIKINNLLNNMLDWGILSGFKYQYNNEAIRLVDAVNQAVALFTTNIERNSIIILLEIQDSIMVNTDSKILNIILRNIFANAIANTQQNSEIKIWVEDNDRVSLFVQNSSTIEQNKLEYINALLSLKIQPEVGKLGLGLGILLISEYCRILKIKATMASDSGIITTRLDFT